MKFYLVGGAVRDSLLGLNIKDRDWVVVGATAQDLLQRGFVAVGRDFPVFHHPQTHEEYALARTERKTAKGYTGFSVETQNVTLEQDLMRRDLTINAMAQDPENGRIIDPFNGRQDLQNGILRHVSPAFAEDPVRILRVARFAGRFGFTVAPETLNLMRNMVENGEINALVAERVWQEFAKGLMEKNAPVMIETLRNCGALAVILPEINALFDANDTNKGLRTLAILQNACDRGLSLAERYSALLYFVGKPLTPQDILMPPQSTQFDSIWQVNQRLKAPKHCAELAQLVAHYRLIVEQTSSSTPEIIVKTLQKMDAFRRPERLHMLLRVCQTTTPNCLDFWLEMGKCASQINTQAIVLENQNTPKNIPQAIEQARCDKVSWCLQTVKN